MVPCSAGARPRRVPRCQPAASQARVLGLSPPRPDSSAPGAPPKLPRPDSPCPPASTPPSPPVPGAPSTGTCVVDRVARSARPRPALLRLYVTHAARRAPARARQTTAASVAMSASSRSSECMRADGGSLHRPGARTLARRAQPAPPPPSPLWAPRGPTPEGLLGDEGLSCGFAGAREQASHGLAGRKLAARAPAVSWRARANLARNAGAGADADANVAIDIPAGLTNAATLAGRGRPTCIAVSRPSMHLPRPWRRRLASSVAGAGLCISGG